MMKWIDKFFELFSGPYKINRILGEATYELVECDTDKVREKFNVRQIKAYYEPAKEVRVMQKIRITPTARWLKGETHESGSCPAGPVQLANE